MAAPTINDLRDAVTTLLAASVPSGVQVHSYFRLSTSDAQMRAQIQSTVAGDTRFRAWMVSLAESDTGLARFWGSGQEQVDYTFAMHGWMTVDDADATERKWCDELEGIALAFRAAPRLNRTDIIEAGPIQIAAFGYRRVPPKDEGYLCHYAMLTYRIRVQARP